MYEEINALEDQKREIERKLKEAYQKKKDEDIRNVDNNYLGKCYRNEEVYYRVISSLTPEHPYRVWAISFIVNPKIHYLKSLSSYDIDNKYAYDVDTSDFLLIASEHLKTLKNFEEISEEKFFAAYDEYCSNVKELLKQTKRSDAI